MQQQTQPQRPITPSNSASTIRMPVQAGSDSGEISRRAYHSYVAEGMRPGDDLRHWLQAEAQVRAERGKPLTDGALSEAQYAV